MTAITNADLTTKSVTGTGVFDVLMQAAAAHLESEFGKNRIKGTEYAEVYLGAMTQVLQTATQFLLSKQKADLEAQLLAKQILLVEAQIAREASQTTFTEQQTTNLIAEKLRIDAQTAQVTAETLNIPKQGLLIEANKNQAVQQTANLVTQQAQIVAQTELVTQQKANAIIEGTVLVAQECKLRAEYDLTMANITRTGQETLLLTQKTATEKAQVLATGVDGDSVVGRQKALYLAQTNGFTRDAEQKAAKVMVDSWNVRRTTDEGTVADSTNMLNDAAVGRAVNKLLGGVGA